MCVLVVMGCFLHPSFGQILFSKSVLIPRPYSSTLSDGPADLVILGASVETRNLKADRTSNSAPRPTAVAIRSGRIVAVGSDEAIREWIDSGLTRVVDARGRTLVPGFVESHGHLTGLGSLLMELDLTAAKSWNEVVVAVAEKAKTVPKGQWIVGRGWHQSLWDQPPMPNVEGYPLHDELSAVTPDHPVFLVHRSGHASLANAEAMRRAKVNAATKDPEGGEILRGTRSEPTGIFRETATQFISQAYEASREEMTRAELEAELDQQVLLAQEKCFQVGVTTFVDAGVSPDLAMHYLQMAERGKLRLPLWLMLRGSNETLSREIPKLRQVWPGHPTRLTLGGVKQMADGALGSHGAWLLEPYADLPQSEGLVVTPLETIERAAEICFEHDLQLCVHAIGDRANREILNLYEPFVQRAKAEGRDLRWRIEHAQHLHPDDLPRFSELGVIASMQAIHATSDGPFVVERLGMTRARQGAYVWRTLLEHDTVIANGSDTPVEPIDPLLGFTAAVTRKCRDGQVFFGEQAMSREQALRSYTIDAAFAVHQETQVGSIEVGKWADLVLLSDDPLRCSDENLAEIHVEMTWVEGNLVYERSLD